MFVVKKGIILILRICNLVEVNIILCRDDVSFRQTTRIIFKLRFMFLKNIFFSYFIHLIAYCLEVEITRVWSCNKG
jgi:hypothetical protein